MLNFYLLFIWDLISNHTLLHFSLLNPHLRLIYLVFLSIIIIIIGSFWYLIIVINIDLIIQLIFVRIAQIFDIFLHLFCNHWTCRFILLLLWEIIKFNLHIIFFILMRISLFNFLGLWNNIIFFIFIFLLLSSILVRPLIVRLRSIKMTLFLWFIKLLLLLFAFSLFLRSI